MVFSFYLKHVKSEAPERFVKSNIISIGYANCLMICCQYLHRASGIKMTSLLTLRSRLFSVLIVLVLGGILLTYTYQKNAAKAMAYLRMYKRVHVKEMPRPLDDVLLAEHQPKPGRSIFFLETTRVTKNISDMKSNMLQLTARQACAIESAAFHNPNFQVFILFIGPIYRYPDNSSRRQSPIIDAILSYKNVHLRQLNVWRYVEGTPIEEWVKEGDLFESK